MKKIRYYASTILILSLVLSFIPVFSLNAAGKKTVYVLDKMETNTYEGQNLVKNTTTNYKYSKGGFLIKDGNYKFKYDSNKNIKQIQVGTTNLNIERTSKGYLKSAQPQSGSMYGTKIQYVVDKKGNVKKMKSGDATYTYTYNKAGRSVLDKRNGENSTSYEYDSAGNLMKLISYDGGADENGIYAEQYRTNNYENGRIASSDVSFNRDSVTLKYIYHYKTMKVDKSLVNSIKEQQWSLINMDLNHELVLWN